MKLFEHSTGTIFAVGFDMKQRRPDPRIISVSDPDGETWQPAVGNRAEAIHLPEDIDPDHIFELDDKVIAVQHRKIFVLTPQETGPWVWLVTIMRPDEPIQEAYDRWPKAPGADLDDIKNDMIGGAARDDPTHPEVDPAPSMSEVRDKVRSALRNGGFKDLDSMMANDHSDLRPAIMEHEITKACGAINGH